MWPIVHSTSCTPVQHPLVAVVGVGNRDAAVNEVENLDEARENVRQAVAAGVNALKSVGASRILVDACAQPQAAAEGAHLALFAYDEHKKEAAREKFPSLELLGTEGADAWKRGALLARCQNIARRLAEMPCNLLSPTIFAQEAQQLLNGHATVFVRDEQWARQKGMNAFLAVNAGSATPAVLLEVHVEPEKDTGLAPIVLIGKGVCFDSGGISLKPPLKMDTMRADMMAAACLVSAAYGTVNGAD